VGTIFVYRLSQEYLFFFFILGAIATWFISLDWNDTILIIARFAIITNLIAFIGGLKLFGGKNNIFASAR